jgi:ribosomal protein S18 acetylase RimI-like enzyme
VSEPAAARRDELTIRPARISECAEIAALAALLLPETWSEAQLSSEVALPEGRVWVARGERALLGFLVARRELDELHVLLTGVAAAARRRGTASRLFGAVLERERGLARVQLEVRESNAGAQAFYRALGFHPSGRRPRHYPGGEAAILMSRSLESRG